MKKTIKVFSARVLAVVLVLSLLVPCAVVSSVSAANPVSYSGAQSVTMNSNTQTYYTMSFSPTDAIPLAYQDWAGGYSSVEESIAAAEAEGYTVYGATNGEFFSPHGYDNAGTLTGRLITDGRIISDHVNLEDTCLAINSDGSFALVSAPISYHFYIEGTELGSAVIHRINKRYHGNWGFDPLCYFDSACGSKTDTVAAYPGVEVVFEKTNNTELVVDGILQGKVVSVNDNTYATPFSENQFVLYACNGTAYHDTLAALTVGQEVQVYAKVNEASAKATMKKAMSVTSATYPIIENGAITVGNITSDPDNLIGQRAQRTAIGVKADGTYVMLVSKGRETGTNTGFTLWELAQLMLDMGCTTAINLDGGGSTAMNYNGSSVLTYNRDVGSSILIVARKDMSNSTEKTNLQNLINTAKNTSYPAAQQESVNAAVAAAEAVIADTTSSQTCDYQRTYMDLQLAMGLVKDVSPKKYISLVAKDWSGQETINVSNDANNALVFKNTDGKWPYADTTVDISVSTEDVFEFDITVASQSSFIFNTRNGMRFNTVFGGSIDSGSGNINAGTYKGSMTVSDLVDAMAAASQSTDDPMTRADILGDDGKLDISAVRIFAVGSAGAGSQVTVRTLGFRSKYAGGDLNGDGSLNSADARLALLATVGKVTLSDAQKNGGDLTGDGEVTAADARQILLKRVGLA